MDFRTRFGMIVYNPDIVSEYSQVLTLKVSIMVTNNCTVYACIGNHAKMTPLHVLTLTKYIFMFIATYTERTLHSMYMYVQLCDSINIPIHTYSHVYDVCTL